MGYLRKLISLLVVLLLTHALTACMLGPNFHSPRAPCVCSYTPMPIPKKTIAAPKAGKAGKAQTFVYGKNLPADWWYMFHSKPLDLLIRSALLNSPNLAAAKAALMQAQETLNAQIGSTLLPAVGAQGFVERQRFTPTIFGGSVNSPRGSSVFTLYNASLNLSYTLDIFGGLRRQVESLAAQAENQGFELEAAFLTLSSNITTTAFTIASLRGQIHATRALIRSQQEELTIVQRQFQLGGASKADVLSQLAQLEQTRATLPPLLQSLAKNLHALSVLIGEFPCEDHLPKFSLEKFDLPTRLPVSLPSCLVRQRPDIRAAEALLHAASAQIGVATANLFPQINITGNAGYSSDVFPMLFSDNAKLWNITTMLTQPIFKGGSLLAQRRAAIAAYQQAAATYRQTVLQAFQNVADTLRALQHDARTLKAQRDAEIAARDSLQLVREQYRLGGVNYINLLIAERTYQTAVINRIQAQAARYTDTAALFVALGGGWWNRTSLDCNVCVNCNVARYAPECM